jgi:DNA-directed RNA polymerase specialized sigma24 family protein
MTGATGLRELVSRVVEGDDAAWRAFWRAVEPTVWAVTGKWQYTGPLAQRDDDRRNIVVDVMERLREGGCRRLRGFLESSEGRGGSSFKAWLATVTARAAIDYVRAHPEYVDPRGAGASTADGALSRWIRIVPMPASEPAAPGLDPVRIATASVLLERARQDLDRAQLSALYLWLQGEDAAAIAERLGLATPRDAERLVRAALKRLRDRYAAADSRDADEEAT